MRKRDAYEYQYSVGLVYTENEEEEAGPRRGLRQRMSSLQAINTRSDEHVQNRELKPLYVVCERTPLLLSNIRHRRAGMVELLVVVGFGVRCAVRLLLILWDRTLRRRRCLRRDDSSSDPSLLPVEKPNRKRSADVMVHLSLIHI